MQLAKNQKTIILLIILLITISATVLITKYLEKDPQKKIEYTDKEVKDNTFVYLSKYHRSFINYWDETSGYDQNFYNLEVYVESEITTTACITIAGYNDDIESYQQKLSFNLFKGETVVKSTTKFAPDDLLYNGETFEKANLSWKVTEITSGECK